MTSRERWLAALDFAPLDRLPFWPKLGSSYPRAQASPFCDLSLPALHDWIGSDRHEWLPSCVREIRARTSVETVTSGAERRTVYHTGYGDLDLRERWDEPSQSWHPVKFPVQAKADVAAVTAFYEDCRVEYDLSAAAEARAQREQLRQVAVSAESVGESPLMYWLEFLAGIHNGQLLLADYPAEVETLFAAQHRLLLRRAEILSERSPADLLYMVENTSTTVISPAQFRRYCSPCLSAYAGVAQAAGRRLVLHMCGHLHALLPDLADLGAAAVEALTSPPVGNTALADARRACPHLALIGGTNAVLWTRPTEEIIAQLAAELDSLPHHRGLVVTSAGVMPPRCSPETIREVCRWVQAYPLRLN